MKFDSRINKKNWRKAIVVLPGEEVNLETVSDYRKPEQTGEVLVKAVVAEGGRLTLRGMIRIGKKARGTEAFLRQNVLLLGKKAAAVAIPELEINNNQVRASHAASVGQIDQEQLFYLESRGVSPDLAKRMIIESFLEEVIAGADKNEVKSIKTKLAKL